MMIRKLNAKDTRIVAMMIRQALPALENIELSQLETETETDHKIRLVKQVLPALMDACFDEAWSWLASLAEMTVEEFEQQPPQFPIEVGYELSKSDGLADFFSSVRKLIA